MRSSISSATFLAFCESTHMGMSYTTLGRSKGENLHVSRNTWLHNLDTNTPEQAWEQAPTPGTLLAFLLYMAGTADIEGMRKPYAAFIRAMYHVLTEPILKHPFAKHFEDKLSRWPATIDAIERLIMAKGSSSCDLGILLGLIPIVDYTTRYQQTLYSTAAGMLFRPETVRIMVEHNGEQTDVTDLDERWFSLLNEIYRITFQREKTLTMNPPAAEMIADRLLAMVGVTSQMREHPEWLPYTKAMILEKPFTPGEPLVIDATESGPMKNEFERLMDEGSKTTADLIRQYISLDVLK